MQFWKSHVTKLRMLKLWKRTLSGSWNLYVLCLYRASKERQEVRNPTLTLPDQDFKGFKSKPAIFQHCALRQSSNDASRLSTPHKASAQESEEKRNLNKSGKTAKTFVPPFKTKLTFSTSEQGSSKRCDSPISKNMTEEREINQITIEKDTAETRDHPSCILHAADTDLENGNLGIFGFWSLTYSECYQNRTHEWFCVFSQTSFFFFNNKKLMPKVFFAGKSGNNYFSKTILHS